LGPPNVAGVDFDADELESEDIDLTEIETTQGYGKKDGIQPGNIMDALATLNPNKFGSSETAKVPSERKPKDISQFKRLPTPGDVNSSTTPAYMLLNTRGINAGLIGLQNSAIESSNGPSSSCSGGSTSATSVSGKKKSAPPPKKLADIGARAEEKHHKMMAKRKERMNLFGAAGSRLDDLDAFLFSDDDDGDNEKPGKHDKKGELILQNRFY
uniref:TIP_N domain-containing protein n=1 Tax=Rodentolepis nana TaxID=102285 RepID=A0A0R3TC19_RODNA